MDLERIIEKYVDGQVLSPEESRFLTLALDADKEEVARFRVSKAEKLFIMLEAKKTGLSMSEYLRKITVKRVAEIGDRKPG